MMCEVKPSSWHGVGVGQPLNVSQPISSPQSMNMPQPVSSPHTMNMPQPSPHDTSSWSVDSQHGMDLPAFSGVIDDAPLLVVHDLDEVRRSVEGLDERLKQIEQMENTLFYQCQESQKRNHQLQQMQSSSSIHPDVLQRAHLECTRFEDVLKDRSRDIHQNKASFIESMRGITQQLGYIEQIILDKHIANWHRYQQLSGNGHGYENHLDEIQEVCEIFAELLWHNLELVQRLHYVNAKIPGNTAQVILEACALLENQLKSLLSVFISGTFVIEKQPPQVMKTNTRFSTTLRLLVGGRLNIYLTPPQVKASIISEAQACNLTRSDGYPTTDVSGEILNHVSSMEFNAATKHLSCSFRNMSLKKIKRAEKKGTESVMDEKFCLLYQSVVKVATMTFAIRTQSLPVVVIVHGNQEPHAWATVTWDNAFSHAQRIPFIVPDAVTWKEMAHVLSTKFRWATGRGLSEGNLHMLASKALRIPNLPVDYENQLITWSQFCKEPLPDRSFTFWEWFYAIMKVTREHLRTLWNDGTIWGFVGRREAENSLLKRPHGTFLLRFSDSELGGVTIGWVNENEGYKQILMVQPFTARDFQIRSLADRISDLATLMYLYPDIPRDQAFGKYYSQNPAVQTGQSSSGYIKPMLVFQLCNGRPYL